jgi:hypothetical protein
MTASRKHKLHERPELLQERIHDTYRARATPAGPMVCDGCGAVFVAGRWRWVEAPADAQRGKCAACQRVDDRYPAGVVECSGTFLARHADEVIGIAYNLEALERANRPLERIMSVATEDGSVVIETTGTHLARRIGKAVARAFHGELELEQPAGEHFVRVHWHRDA